LPAASPVLLTVRVGWSCGAAGCVSRPPGAGSARGRACAARRPPCGGSSRWRAPPRRAACGSRTGGGRRRGPGSGAGLAISRSCRSASPIGSPPPRGSPRPLRLAARAAVIGDLGPLGLERLRAATAPRRAAARPSARPWDRCCASACPFVRLLAAGSPQGVCPVPPARGRGSGIPGHDVWQMFAFRHP
jgi:hypothetical protein